MKAQILPGRLMYIVVASLGKYSGSWKFIGQDHELTQDLNKAKMFRTAWGARFFMVSSPTRYRYHFYNLDVMEIEAAAHMCQLGENWIGPPGNAPVIGYRGRSSLPPWHGSLSLPPDEF